MHVGLVGCVGGGGQKIVFTIKRMPAPSSSLKIIIYQRRLKNFVCFLYINFNIPS